MRTSFDLLDRAYLAHAQLLDLESEEPQSNELAELIEELANTIRDAQPSPPAAADNGTYGELPDEIRQMIVGREWDNMSRDEQRAWLIEHLVETCREQQAAEDMLAHAQELQAPVVSGVLELDSFLRSRGRS